MHALSLLVLKRRRAYGRKPGVQGVDPLGLGGLAQTPAILGWSQTAVGLPTIPEFDHLHSVVVT